MEEMINNEKEKINRRDDK